MGDPRFRGAGGSCSVPVGLGMGRCPRLSAAATLSWSCCFPSQPEQQLSSLQCRWSQPWRPHPYSPPLSPAGTTLWLPRGQQACPQPCFPHLCVLQGHSAPRALSGSISDHSHFPKSSPGCSPVTSGCAGLLGKVLGFPSGSVVKRPCRRLGFNPWDGRSPGEGNGNTLQYFCLRIPSTEEPGGLPSMGSQGVGHD